MLIEDSNNGLVDLIKIAGPMAGTNVLKINMFMGEKVL